ncbi:hypothetical protein [Thermocrinis sp.]|uniref:hypothetical protein n=1 Tax=Thermocrinis sp. TaxID=2024383 RepID=UPI003C7100C3
MILKVDVSIPHGGLRTGREPADLLCGRRSPSHTVANYRDYARKINPWRYRL